MNKKFCKALLQNSSPNKKCPIILSVYFIGTSKAVHGLLFFFYKMEELVFLNAFEAKGVRVIRKNIAPVNKLANKKNGLFFTVGFEGKGF